jgi:hypothetical protein
MKTSLNSYFSSEKRWDTTEFIYIANDAKRLGKDRVEFEVISKGQTYRVVLRFEIVPNVDGNEDLKSRSKYYSGPCDSKIRRLGIIGALSDLKHRTKRLPKKLI